MTLHCHKCGEPWSLSGQPGRGESCPKCRADLRVCVNCLFHDRSAAYECRERRAEPVADKETANFCEYFEFRSRVWAGTGSDPRGDRARAALKDLLGD